MIALVSAGLTLSLQVIPVGVHSLQRDLAVTGTSSWYPSALQSMACTDPYNHAGLLLQGSRGAPTCL